MIKQLDFLKPFYNTLTMSAGYVFPVGMIIVMYTLLPVVYTDIRGTKMAGIMMMLMTIGQILLFGPLAASFVDTYGARKILFAYTSFFSL